MIKIICLGKIKENYIKEAIKDYEKRITKYLTLEIIELSDEKTDDKKVALRKEKEKILKALNPKDYIITLEVDKEEYTSNELAGKLDRLFINNSNIVFIIGGSFGLDEDIKKIANESISFSKLTFPHQLFRLILLEQLYRCFKINNNEEYHK
jgi:Uncharacterized conserved protein